MAIAAGYLHSIALRSNRTLVVWGDNTYGQTNAPAYLTNAVAIAARDGRSFAITIDLKLLSLEAQGADALLRFRGFAGRQYAVEYLTDLRSNNWNELPPGVFPGNGADAVVVDANALAFEKRFYRVKQLP